MTERVLAILLLVCLSLFLEGASLWGWAHALGL